MTSLANLDSLLSGRPNSFASPSSNTHKSSNVTFRVVDWNDRLEIFDSNDIFNVTSAIELLSLGSVVVCDRLHAAILSYLAGLPFVYLDQTSGKLTKTLSTAFSRGEGCLDGEIGGWRKADHLQDAVTKALDMIGLQR